MQDYDPETHARFLADLKLSDEYVRAVAAWLEARGWSCEVAPLRYAPTAAERRAYSDHGDMRATPPGGSRPFRVEVKRNRITFRGREDWPYPRFFLTRVDRFEACRPDIIVRVSHDRRAFGFVTAGSRGSWEQLRVKDFRYPTQPAQLTYSCSPDIVQWRVMEAPVDARV